MEIRKLETYRVGTIDATLRASPRCPGLKQRIGLDLHVRLDLPVNDWSGLAPVPGMGMGTMMKDYIVEVKT